MLDIDNNGTMDVAVTRDRGMWLIYTDGAGHISLQAFQFLQSREAYVFTIGDYNDDGINDVIYVNRCCNCKIL